MLNVLSTEVTWGGVQKAMDTLKPLTVMTD